MLSGHFGPPRRSTYQINYNKHFIFRNSSVKYFHQDGLSIENQNEKKTT